jgi:hypothetical protein
LPLTVKPALAPGCAFPLPPLRRFGIRRPMLSVRAVGQRPILKKVMSQSTSLSAQKNQTKKVIDDHMRRNTQELLKIFQIKPGAMGGLADRRARVSSPGQGSLVQGLMSALQGSASRPTPLKKGQDSAKAPYQDHTNLAGHPAYTSVSPGLARQATRDSYRQHQQGVLLAQGNLDSAHAKLVERRRSGLETASVERQIRESEAARQTHFNEMARIEGRKPVGGFKTSANPEEILPPPYQDHTTIPGSAAIHTVGPRRATMAYLDGILGKDPRYQRERASIESDLVRLASTPAYQIGERMSSTQSVDWLGRKSWTPVLAEEEDAQPRGFNTDVAHEAAWRHGLYIRYHASDRNHDLSPAEAYRKGVYYVDLPRDISLQIDANLITSHAKAERQDATRRFESWHDASEALNSTAGKVLSQTSPASWFGHNRAAETAGTAIASNFNPISQAEFTTGAIMDPVGALGGIVDTIGSTVLPKHTDGSPVTTDDRVRGLVSTIGMAAGGAEMFSRTGMVLRLGEAIDTARSGGFSGGWSRSIDPVVMDAINRGVKPEALAHELGKYGPQIVKRVQRLQRYQVETSRRMNTSTLDVHQSVDYPRTPNDKLTRAFYKPAQDRSHPSPYAPFSPRTLPSAIDAAENAKTRPMVADLSRLPDTPHFQTLRQHAMAAYRRLSAVSSVYQPELKATIQFPTSGLGKVIGGDRLKLRLIPYLPEIVENGHWFRTEEMKRPPSGINMLGTHRLVTHVITPSGTFNVWSVIRQIKGSDHFFYDMQHTRVVRLSSPWFQTKKNY